MDSVRDLAGAQLWRESLERSRARRSAAPSSTDPPKDPGSHAARQLPRAAWQLPRPAWQLLRAAWQLLRLAMSRRWGRLAAGAGGILVLVLLAAMLPSASDGRGENARPKLPGQPAHRAELSATLAVPGSARPSGRASAGASVRQPACDPVGISSGYLNPLASAVVTPKRIDQGVDYTGSGTLTALGPATITEIALTDTGWPGAFIEYRLTEGPAAGCYVFYAEGVTPAPGLQVGQPVRTGQAIATIIVGYRSGIEIGWGAGVGTETYAAQLGQWSSTHDEESIPTEAGRSFSALIAMLGGPPGKVGG